jgi:hypothetical protein
VAVGGVGLAGTAPLLAVPPDAFESATASAQTWTSGLGAVCPSAARSAAPSATAASLGLELATRWRFAAQLERNDSRERVRASRYVSV